MPAIPFEYEERYKVVDLEAARQSLTAAGFKQTNAEIQIDHWFIPKDIMSPAEQTHWFDYEKGYAVRIREKTTEKGAQSVITAKQLIVPGDHSTMTNYEDDLTAAGVRHVLSSVGEEFSDLLRGLQGDDGQLIPFAKVKSLLEWAGRKEYITLHKERATFRNPSVPEVVIDLDVIPALKETALGYYAAVEIEYTGHGSAQIAGDTVRSTSRKIGYDEKDILAKALPGQAIAYLAKF